MKLLLPVPIRKVPVGPCAHSFVHEGRLVDVMAVSRTPAGHERWHYVAHYTSPDAHPDAPRAGVNGSLTCWVRRASHPKWAPPAFPDGHGGPVFIDGEAWRRCLHQTTRSTLSHPNDQKGGAA